MIRICIIIFALWLLVGCVRPTGGPAQPGEAPPEHLQPGEAPPVVPQDESFDPLTLNDDEIGFSSFRASVDTTVDTTMAREGPKQVNGFRVQIFAGADEQTARLVEEEARFEFDTSVYLAYDPPNYKVRLGDFAERSDAEKIRREAYRKGYRDAWVVPDQVWIGLPAESDTTNVIPDTLRMEEVLPDIEHPTPR
jgi:hypothetical protein